MATTTVDRSPASSDVRSPERARRAGHARRRRVAARMPRVARRADPSAPGRRGGGQRLDRRHARAPPTGARGGAGGGPGGEPGHRGRADRRDRAPGPPRPPTTSYWCTTTRRSRPMPSNASSRRPRASRASNAWASSAPRSSTGTSRGSCGRWGARPTGSATPTPRSRTASWTRGSTTGCSRSCSCPPPSCWSRARRGSGRGRSTSASPATTTIWTSAGGRAWPASGCS